MYYTKRALCLVGRVLFISIRKQDLPLTAESKLEGPPSSQALPEDKLPLGRREAIDKKAKTHI